MHWIPNANAIRASPYSWPFGNTNAALNAILLDAGLRHVQQRRDIISLHTRQTLQRRHIQIRHIQTTNMECLNCRSQPTGVTQCFLLRQRVITPVGIFVDVISYPGQADGADPVLRACGRHMEFTARSEPRPTANASRQVIGPGSADGPTGLCFESWNRACGGGGALRR